MDKNYLISTGGSGGHVIPGIILYEHLIKEANVIISSDKRGLKYLKKGYELKNVTQWGEGYEKVARLSLEIYEKVIKILRKR